ncbi:MAG: hypothetical protein H0U18_09280 [Pyrinomonadaceae bacterium]|nr:hypothetical protein [Pyrinomonadaceae bacterium]
MSMLFIESKTLSLNLDGPGRIRLLERLREKNLIPLIRSARFNLFNYLLLGQDHIAELETAIALSAESENQEAYIRGDLFCISDHVFFIVFDEYQEEAPVVRAGIVYETRTTEPYRKLDAFCREVREMVLPQRESSTNETENAESPPQWQHGKPRVPEGFKRFIAKQDTDSLYTSLRKETMGKRVRAASLLEDASARVFLRRAQEAHVEGYAAKLLAGDAFGSYESSIGTLEDAGLVGREVQISCRKTGHALFRLPNAHALAVVTVSDATCSECGCAVVDEKVEEVLAPTLLASSLLEDGSWLISRLHYLLREQGVPESEIAVSPSNGDGYGQMMANICGESFLLMARDGDLTPAFARWAIDQELETEASHLVVVATGRVHNQAGVLLHNHARQRVQAGHDFEMVLADEAAVAGKELRLAFERVSQRILDEQLCNLDSSIGLSISRLVITKFKLRQSTAEDGGSQNLSSDSEPEFLHPNRPLALASYVSVNARSVLTPEEVISEATESFAGENADSMETRVNSGHQG